MILFVMTDCSEKQSEIHIKYQVVGKLVYTMTVSRDGRTCANTVLYFFSIKLENADVPVLQ